MELELVNGSGKGCEEAVLELLLLLWRLRSSGLYLPRET
jgi:hypothetical protein